MYASKSSVFEFHSLSEVSKALFSAHSRHLYKSQRSSAFRRPFGTSYRKRAIFTAAANGSSVPQADSWSLFLPGRNRVSKWMVSESPFDFKRLRSHRTLIHAERYGWIGRGDDSRNREWGEPRFHPWPRFNGGLRPHSCVRFAGSGRIRGACSPGCERGSVM